MPFPETLLIIVGDELLGGFTTDLNGALAARRLFQAGYPSAASRWSATPSTTSRRPCGGRSTIRARPG